MGAILPTLKKPEPPPPPPLPELTAEAKQGELAAFEGQCKGEAGEDVCQKTQALQEPGNVRVLVTSCAGCDVRRVKEFRA